jgi:hypothetical protein
MCAREMADAKASLVVEVVWSSGGLDETGHASDDRER